MNDKNMAVLTNIIGAVESGGQIYGNRRYEAYAGPYTNSNKEVTCTLGWAQNYGNEGRKLCKMILQKDPTAFRKADTANIESKLSMDWVAAKWAPTTAQKKALIAIITTDAGKQCQDDLFAQLMNKYIKNAEDYGVTSVPAQMMWCEIEHLGGLSPTKRIFARAAKPYTPDTIYASLVKDQQDTSNNNQVGDKKFQSRHECCVKWIKQYAVTEGEESMISNCGHDENGRYSGGAAGDQTGTEWEIRSWYNRPWNYVLRHPDAKVRDMIASMAEAAAKNNLIGYDQNDRYTFWEHLKASNYDPAQITIKCEADCSSGVAAIVKGAGYRLNNAALKGVSIYCYTGNIRPALKAAGFTVLSASKYLTSASYLQRGDILLYEGHHVATNLTTGSKAGSGSESGSGGTLNESVKWNGTVTAALNVRKWAGTGNALCSFSPLATGTVVGICDTVQAPNGDPWYYILYNGKHGFVSADYVKQESGQTVENEIIAAGQTHVNHFCNAGITVDGVRGEDTKRAGIKAVQHAMNLDYNAGVKEDGLWGTESAAALDGHYVKKGETQYMVTALEILFMLNGYECGGVESPGVFGAGLEETVTMYKGKKGWTVNGTAGKGTFLSLMGVSA